MVEITTDIYAWLTSINMFDNDDESSENEFQSLNQPSIINFSINENGNVFLESSFAKVIYSGFFFVKLFHKLNSKLNLLYGNIYKSDERCSSVINDNQPGIKLRNFEIIVDIVKNYYGIVLDSDYKTLLIAGDNSTFSDFFHQLYKFYLDLEDKLKKSKKEEKDQNKVERSTNQLRLSEEHFELPKIRLREDFVNLEDLEGNSVSKPLNQTRSVLEFIIITIGKSFNLSGKQAASLLADGKKYLTHIVVKGLSKKNFDPVILFYSEVMAHVSHLVCLIQINSIAYPNQMSKNIEMTLSTFKLGLLSKSVGVVHIASRVMTRLSFELTENNFTSNAWDWFIEPKGGLEAAILSLKKHNSVKESVVTLLTHFGKFHIYELFTVHLKVALTNDGAYLDFLSDLLESLSALQSFTEDFVKNNLKDYFLELIAESIISYNLNTRIQSAVFITEFWINFSFYLEEEEENSKLVNSMKKLTRDTNKLVQYSAITGLFRILSKFAKERNSYAPVIYKSLTFILIENHANFSLKEFIISNFASLFKEVMSIPVGILVEPYAKQINLTLGTTYFFNLMDVNFLFTLTKHPRLNIKDAIVILDVLGKVYFEVESGIYLYSVVRSVFTAILSRYLFNEVGVEFCFKYVKILIETFCKLDKSLSDKIYTHAIAENINPEDKAGVINSPFGHLTIDLRDLTKSAICEMLLDILNINNTFVNSFIKSLLLVADLRHFKVFSFHNTGLTKVIDYFGNSSEIVHYFNVNQSELDVDRDFEIMIELIYDRPPKVEKHVTLPSPKNKKDQIESPVFRKSSLKLPSELFSPKNKINKKQISNNPNNRKKPNLQTKSIPTHNNQPNVLKNNISLVDLSTEEDRDLISLKKVLKDYNRFFKYVFFKYCGSIYHPIVGKLFTSIKEITETIAPGEILRMFKEHGIITGNSLTGLISKEEVLLLINLMNSKVFRKPNLKSGFSLDEFIEVFIQMALFTFNRPPHNYANYTIAAYTTELVKLFSKHVKDNAAFNLVDYQHPDDLMTHEESQICKDVNKKLEFGVARSVAVPSSFKKFLDTEVKHKYFVPDCMRNVMTQNHIICYEVLDEIVNSIFGGNVHLLESFSFVKEVYKIRPAFIPNKVVDLPNKEVQVPIVNKRGRQKNQVINVKPLKEVINSVSINKIKIKNKIKLQKTDRSKIENSNLEPREDEQMKIDEPGEDEKMKINQPQFTNTKREVNPSPSPKTLKTLKTLINKSKEKDQPLIEGRDRKRKLRVQYIKEEIEKMKESKRERELKREGVQKDEKRKKEDKLRKKAEDEMKLREKIKSEILKIKKTRNQEERKKIENEKNKNLTVAKKTSERNDVFINIQIAKLQEEFRKKADERKLEVAKQRLDRKFQSEKLEEERRKFEDFFEREKRTKEVERQLYDQIDNLTNKEGVKSMLNNYDEHLKLLSNIYTSTKTNVLNKVSNTTSGIHLEDFTNFCNHFNISNVLLDNQEVQHIFKKLSKTNSEKFICTSTFNTAIIYICLFSLKNFNPNLPFIPKDKDINQIKYLNKINKVNSLGGEALNSFFTLIGLTVPFNRKELESYINIQRNMSVKDKQRKELGNRREGRISLAKRNRSGKRSEYSESKYSESQNSDG